MECVTWVDITKNIIDHNHSNNETSWRIASRNRVIIISGNGLSYGWHQAPVNGLSPAQHQANQENDVRNIDFNEPTGPFQTIVSCHCHMTYQTTYS